MKRVLWLFAGFALAFTSMSYAQGGFSDAGRFAEWYQGAVERVSERGLITGHSDGSFRPTENVTRAQLAVILDRLADEQKPDHTDNEPPEDINCTLEETQGFIVHLRDQDGRPLRGARIRQYRNPAYIPIPGTDLSDAEVAINFEELDGTYVTYRPGQVTYRISKEGYSDHIETINVDSAPCAFDWEVRTITLVKETLL